MGGGGTAARRVVGGKGEHSLVQFFFSRLEAYLEVYTSFVRSAIGGERVETDELRRNCGVVHGVNGDGSVWRLTPSIKNQSGSSGRRKGGILTLTTIGASSVRPCVRPFVRTVHPFVCSRGFRNPHHQFDLLTISHRQTPSKPFFLNSSTGLPARVTARPGPASQRYTHVVYIQSVGDEKLDTDELRIESLTVVLVREAAD